MDDVRWVLLQLRHVCFDRNIERHLVRRLALGQCIDVGYQHAQGFRRHGFAMLVNDSNRRLDIINGADAVNGVGNDFKIRIDHVV